VRNSVVVTLLLLGGTVAILAQNSLQLRVDVQLTALDVYVDDATGKPVTNLTSKDFTILEDGQPREIRSFESAETPYHILLLFDRSSSTEEQWPFLIKAVSRFLDQLPDRHRVALAAFDEKAEMLYTWSRVRDFARQAFLIRSQNSGTDLYGALEWSARELRTVNGRKGVIAFTDGVDNRLSKKLVSFDRSGIPNIAPLQKDDDFLRVLRTVVQSRFPIYFVAVNTDQNPDPRIPHNAFDLKQRTAGRMRMEVVAERSNGVLHLPRQMEDIGNLYAKIGKELGYSYNLAFTPANSQVDGSFHKIEIRVADKSMRVTQSREGYYAR
jgi:VWFA-related protein